MFLGNDSAKGDHYKTLEGAFKSIGMWNFQFKRAKWTNFVSFKQKFVFFLTLRTNMFAQGGLFMK